MDATNNGQTSILGIANWLEAGWKDLVSTKGASSLYAGFFLLIGVPLYVVFLVKGLSLAFFVIASGFLLLAPVLTAGYYDIYRKLHNGEQISLLAGFAGIRQVPLTVWVIGIVSAVLYLIWVTDALILYSFYFSSNPVPLAAFLEDPVIRGDAISFLAYSSILGLVLALIVFCITAYSIPRAFYAGFGLADSIVFSIKTIGRHKRVTLSWALLIGASLLFASVVLPPALIVLLPLLTYANAAAYKQLSQGEE